MSENGETRTGLLPARLVREKSILIVDDMSMMREIVDRMCQRLGFETVDRAPDGISCLDLLRERQHDFVISDLRMEPMSGLDLLRAIRGDSTLKKVRFILMSIELDPHVVSAARRAGVDQILTKPFTIHALSRAVAALL